MILVIDDSPIVHMMMEVILSAGGLEPIMAWSGEEGLAQFGAHQSHINAVLLDLQMPGIGGVKTFYQLRTLAPALPIIIFTALEPAEVRPYFPNQPELLLLEKHCGPAELLAALNSSLHCSLDKKGLKEEKAR